MITIYKRLIKELLKKAKKPQLVKFSKEVLGLKISTANKKEVFLEAVTSKVDKGKIDPAKYVEYFGWEESDICSYVTDKDVAMAMEVLGRKVAQLYHEKTKAKNSEEKKKIQKDISRNLALRNRAFVRLINNGTVQVVGISRNTSYCERTEPIYVDTVTGEKINVQRFILLPNMKYCKKPKKNKALDLNNVTYRGDYKVETAKAIINENYKIMYNGKEFSFPTSYKDLIYVDIHEDTLPIIEVGVTPRDNSTPVEVGEIEYIKATYIINRFIKNETRKVRKKFYLKRKARIEAEKELKKYRKLKKERLAMLAEKAKAKAERKAKLAAEAQAKEEAKAKLEAEANTEATSTPEAQANTEATPAPETQAKAETTPAPKTKAKAKAKSAPSTTDTPKDDKQD